jgi:hypothetical protein
MCQQNVDQFVVMHRKQDHLLHENVAIRDIHRMYQLIDSKSSALLTHVSLMIAACTFLYSSASTKTTTDKLFIVEAFIYMIIALILLFCLHLSMYSAPQDESSCEKYFADDCNKRRNTYLFALYLARLVTFGVILTMIYKVLL